MIKKMFKLENIKFNDYVLNLQIFKTEACLEDTTAKEKNRGCPRERDPPPLLYILYIMYI